jgi:hypothetical protein
MLSFDTHSRCRDIVWKLYELPQDAVIDDDQLNLTDIKISQRREITMMLMCNGGGLTFPSSTSLHFLEIENGKLCYQDRSCGNVEHWEGYIGITSSYMRLTTISKFLPSDGFSEINRDISGYEIGLSLFFKYGQIERYCTPISERVCL